MYREVFPHFADLSVTLAAPRRVQKVRFSAAGLLETRWSPPPIRGCESHTCVSVHRRDRCTRTLPLLNYGPDFWHTVPPLHG